jgi:hypothetical protein
MHNNVKETIGFLLQNNVEFGVICNTSEVIFEPSLPHDILKNIKPIALFVLSNYSFESAYMDEGGESLFFEAGFGPENFASTVSIDTSNIIQIIVEDTPIFINVCAGRKKIIKKPEIKKVETENRSMEKLLSRPENQKFLK